MPLIDRLCSARNAQPESQRRQNEPGRGPRTPRRSL